MSQTAHSPSLARRQLIERLCEVVALPTSRIPQHERDLAADLLVGLLPSCEFAGRKRLAQRLALLADAPKLLLRYLSSDMIDVAMPLLVDGLGLDDSDLVAAIDKDRPGHGLAIAQRRTLGPLVAEALIGLGDFEVTAAVLRNAGAHLSVTAVDVALSQSRQAPELGALLAPRQELRASQALTMFWWMDAQTRALLLRRFAIERKILVDELGEVFLTAAAERWNDDGARTALLMVERRQRTRTDMSGAKANFESAVAHLSNQGFNPQLVAELAHQTSLRPVTAVRIFRDPGGEALAVWAKASGLRREHFEALFRGLRGDAAFEPAGQAAQVQAGLLFDQMAIARAAGVLRVWNWTIGAAAELDVAQAAKPPLRGLTSQAASA